MAAQTAQLDQQQAEELFRVLTELFDRLPDDKPVHLKTPAGKLWVRRRPTGLSVVHTIGGGTAAKPVAA
jgi:hypothetical protein